MELKLYILVGSCYSEYCDEVFIEEPRVFTTREEAVEELEAEYYCHRGEPLSMDSPRKLDISHGAASFYTEGYHGEEDLNEYKFEIKEIIKEIEV